MGQFAIYDACPFCKTRLTTRYDECGIAEYFLEDFRWISRACLACGWWWEGTIPGHTYSIGTTLAGILHKTQDISEPLRLGLEHLRKDSARLFEMAPTKFERFVGDIMSTYYSCRVVYCGKSHDNGIDLLLLECEEGTIPVQVKRRSKPRSVESVALIREFRGAMLLSGYDRGIVVTTADHFSAEAVRASVPKPGHLVPQELDLVDCRKLLQIMHALSSGGGANLQELCTFNLLGGDLSPQADVLERIEASLHDFAIVVFKNH